MKAETKMRNELAIQRTELANQRTLLAYIRIALYFLVASVTITHFIETISDVYGIILMVGSAFFFVYGIYNFILNYMRIEKQKAFLFNSKN